VGREPSTQATASSTQKLTETETLRLSRLILRPFKDLAVIVVITATRLEKQNGSFEPTLINVSLCETKRAR